MAPSQTEIESQVIELAEKSFKTFCGDISGMFGIDIVCSQQQVGPETVSGLKRRFKEFVVVYLVKAEGELDGTFQLVFDRQGLFILAGVVAMHPEHLILENVKFGSLEKVDEVSNILTEVGDALVGAWDRVFQKALDGHGRFVQTNTFIGSPWDDSKKKIGLAGHEKLMFVPIEMTVGSYPTFKCGIIFPKAILADKSESESEAPNVSEAVEEAESKAPNVSEGEKETENRAPTVREGVEEAEGKAQNVSEVEKESKSGAPNVSEGVEKSKPQEPTDEKAAEEKTRTEENTKEATQAEGDAVAEKAKPAAKEAIVADKSAAQQDSEDAVDQKPEAAAEGQPEVVTEGESEAAAEEERPAVAAEESKAAPEEEPEAAAEGEPEAAAEEECPAVAVEESKAVPEQKSDDVNVKEPLTAETDKSEKRPISEAIQKMARSSAVLPGESAPSVTAEKLPLSSEDALLAVCAKDIMQKNVIWGDPEDSLQKSLAKIQQRNAGYMMIGRGDIPEGVVSKSDLTGALSPYLRPTFSKWRRPMDDATLQIKIKWIMSKPTCTVTPETPLSAIMEHICKAGRLCLPVVDQQGKVQGLVTVFDIFKVLLKRSRRI